jgi:hypothetical protein
VANAHHRVISASRRTDIPAFFMPWFMEGIARGEFEVTNPYNRRVTRVAAAAPPVHTIVFWSKNFGPFLEGNYGGRLQAMGYHLYFQFTINSENRVLEPNLPGLDRGRVRSTGASTRSASTGLRAKAPSTTSATPAGSRTPPLPRASAAAR